MEDKRDMNLEYKMTDCESMMIYIWVVAYRLVSDISLAAIVCRSAARVRWIAALISSTASSALYLRHVALHH